MKDVDRKALEEARDQLDKVHGVLSRMEESRDREDAAARILTRVLDIFDNEVQTDTEGLELPEHRGKAAIGRSITDWLNRGGR